MKVVIMDYVSIVSTVSYGRCEVRLRELIEEKGISMTKLSRLANTNYKNIKRLCDGEVQKIDLDILARICFVLGCNISDIIKYEQ